MSLFPAFTPVHSLVGGLMLASSVHALLAQLGTTLGISGFFHGTVRSLLVRQPPAKRDEDEDAQALSDRTSVRTARLFTAGLVAGGVILAAQRSWFEDHLGVKIFETLQAATPLHTAALGALVGLGTKLGSGCTSGHFLCGLSRLSPRSIVATATFFSVAVVTHLLNAAPQAFKTPAVQAHLPDLLSLAALQLPALNYWMMPLRVRIDPGGTAAEKRQKHVAAASVTAFATGVHFAFGLALTGMLRPSKVLGFLALSPARVFGGTGEWDPSLAMVAVGGILPSALGYFATVKPKVDRGASKEADQPLLHAASPKWRLPKAQTIDLKLIGGAALFGVGWGLSGFCPGPVLVNLGAALNSGDALAQLGIFTAALAVSGQLPSLLL